MTHIFFQDHSVRYRLPDKGEGHGMAAETEIIK